MQCFNEFVVLWALHALGFMLVMYGKTMARQMIGLGMEIVVIAIICYALFM